MRPDSGAGRDPPVGRQGPGTFTTGQACCITPRLDRDWLTRVGLGRARARRGWSEGSRGPGEEPLGGMETLSNARSDRVEARLTNLP